METEMSITNECSLERVASEYAPIIADAVGAYRRNLDKLLLSVRLMGSVPRGEASVGVSDIDFVALTSMNTEADRRSMLEAESKRLTAKYPCVGRVDLEIEIKGRITTARDFIFRSDSICVWGEDIYIRTDTKMSNIALAKLVTPDFDKLLSGYRQRLKNPIQAEELGQLCRSVGKDFLKCFRRFLILKLALYKKGAIDIHDQLVSYFPQETDTFDRLLGIHEQPIQKREDLLDVLREATESFRRMEKAAV
jgi:hypothetical protein